MNVSYFNPDILVSQQNLENANAEIYNTLIKISAAQKIENAAADPMDALLSTNVNVEARFLNRAYMNAADSASLLNIASSTTDQASELLIQAEELAIRANSDALSADERALVEARYESIKQNLDDLVSDATFNGQAIFGNSFSFFLGTSESDILEVDISNIDTESLGLRGTNISSAENAASVLSTIQSALNTLADQQTTIGNTQSALSTLSDDLGTRMFYNSTSLVRVDAPDSLESSVDLTKSLINQSAASAFLVHDQKNLTNFLTSIS